MGTPNSTDGNGGHYDSLGNNYKPAGPEPAKHGEQVLVNDGYGNYSPGFIHNGVATTIKKD